MKNEDFSVQGSAWGATVDSIQKYAIQQAILTAIANGYYFDGLEVKACNAIAYINRFSDSGSENILIEKQTGKKYREL